MNSRLSARVRTGATSTDTARDCTLPTAIDLFEKARRHERLERLAGGPRPRSAALFPSAGGTRGPVVEMEGAERIMLGSNNYLGLTGDERVKAAARDALERFGTGLTGSRFLNGTLSLHLQLERELADCMGTEDALVFTAGYLANIGCIATLLSRRDTVICDSGDHASILDAVIMSRACIRPFRHNRWTSSRTCSALRGRRRRGAGGGGRGASRWRATLAPLQEIVELCHRARARLLVDPGSRHGRAQEPSTGTCPGLRITSEVDLRMGTFKVLASCSRFVARPHRGR